MKKLLSFLLLIIFTGAIFSCQDEFCLDATTPNLIIRFYDNDTITNTKKIQLTVWANNLDSIYNAISLDSISLPLNTQNNSVTYHLTKFDTAQPNRTEDITITYEIEDVFVSKACGFKSVFNNVTITTTNNDWLLNATPSTSFNVTNQTNAHVKIFH